MHVDSNYQVKLSHGEITRLCARSQVQSYARRYQDARRCEPGLGWGIGVWVFILLGSLAFWALIIRVIVGVFS